MLINVSEYVERTRTVVANKYLSLKTILNVDIVYNIIINIIMFIINNNNINNV